MKLDNKIFKVLSLGLLSVLIYSGCKKYDNPPPIYEDLVRTVSKQRKVLIIGIDGLGGSELQTIAPANFTAMQKTAKYSMSTINGVSDAGGWVSILTGTGFAKHRVQSDNFERTRNPNDSEHTQTTSYRNMLDYITQFKAVKTGVVTPWESLRKYLSNADFAPVVTTDIAVKDSAVAVLKNQIGLGTLVVNFRDVEAAGANGGFSAANAAYKTAVTTTDGYIGDIMTALKARKTYSNEDWLVIITSNHGGSNAAPTNGFMMTYNPSLKQQELKKMGFNTVLFNGTGIFAEVPNDNGLYDGGGQANEFTVQMQVKFLSTTSYPCILSKGTGIDGSTQTGWLWLESGSAIGSSWGGTLNGSGVNRGQIDLALAGADGKWRTVTFTVKNVNSTTRTVTTYMDGVQTATGNIATHKSLAALAEKLRIGFKKVDNSGSGNFYAANLAYFNTALSSATILNNIALKDITQHPNYANLTGFWPIDEGADGVVGNKAPGGYNMLLSGQYKWVSLGIDVPAGTTADPNYAASTKSYVSSLGDVSALSLYWMNIKILSDYGFDGTPFLNQYEIEFLK
ncbi:Type I phosphodiesterase / nucleotide pyrophosphatase [compost metagenome]